MGNYVGNDTQNTVTLAADGVSDVAWSTDEKTIYAATTDGTIKVFDVATQALLKTWNIGQTLGGISVSDDGKTLVAGGTTAEGASVVFAIDAATGAASTFTPAVPGVGDVEIVDNQHVLVAGNGSGQVLSLDLKTGAFTQLTAQGYNPAFSIMTEDGHLTLLAEAGISNGPLYVYDDRTGTIVAEGDNYQAGVSSGFNFGIQAISEAAGRIFQFNYYEGINIFDLQAKAIKNVQLSDGPMQGYSITPDGKSVYIYFTSGVVNQYLVSDFSKIGTFTAVSSPNTNGGYGNGLHVTENGGYMSLLSSADPYFSTNTLTLIDVSARNEVFMGTAGADTFAGGFGNDIYRVNDAGDVVRERLSSGTDRVISTIATYTLTANVDILRLGSDAYDGNGNALDNTIIGNAEHANLLYGAGGNDTIIGVGGNDVLQGGTGSDTLISGKGIDELQGNAGNDIFIINDLGDQIIEDPDHGIDTVRVNFDYSLFDIAENVENLELGDKAAIGTGNRLDNRITGNSLANTLDGGSGNDRLLGKDGADTLLGGDGNDTLDGGAGADTMTGGAGDDTYIVDRIDDLITEDALDGGTDTVIASRNWRLSDGLENLKLAPGSAARNATGNALANMLTGNEADNRLDGGLGADRMSGGRGNDLYIVDNKGDRTIEAPDGGIDTVQSALSWRLAAGIEKLTLTGTDAINGTGNLLTNVITGNSADNVLDGGGLDFAFYAGPDLLIGGAGDDTYIVSTSFESAIIEKAGEGIDRVIASNSFNALPDNVEKLLLTGTLSTNGGGNKLANVIVGNSGDNQLSGYEGNDSLFGGAGNDTLDGGAGNDTMRGGAGNDVFEVDSAADVVKEKAGEGEADVVHTVISLTIPQNVEVLILDGTAAIDATGSANADALSGNTGANTLDGKGGDDVLIDNAFNDTLTGGAGADLFVFGTFGAPPGDATTSRITDFSAAEGDRISLAAIDGNPDQAGMDTLAFIGTAAFSGAAGEVRYEQKDGDTLITGDLNGDKLSDFSITLTGLVTLNSTDFVLLL